MCRHGGRATDFATAGAGVLLLLGVALAAGALPARRAARAWIRSPRCATNDAPGAANETLTPLPELS